VENMCINPRSRRATMVVEVVKGGEYIMALPQLTNKAKGVLIGGALVLSAGVGVRQIRTVLKRSCPVTQPVKVHTNGQALVQLLHQQEFIREHIIQLQPKGLVK